MGKRIEPVGLEITGFIMVGAEGPIRASFV